VLVFREAVARSTEIGKATEVRNSIMLSRVLVWAGRMEAAREVLRRVRTVGLDPNMFATWPRRLALASWDAGDAALAREFSARVRTAYASSRIEDQTDLHLVLASLALASGNTAVATAHADSLAARSVNPDVALLRGRVHEAAGRREDAERDFVAASALNRCCTENYFDVTEARIAAARMALARGDTLTARQRLEPLMKDWARGDTGFVAHGWALRTVGQFKTVPR